MRKLIVHLGPTPDLIVFLNNKDETIWSRKKEYSLDTIRASLERYRRVARDYGCREIWTGDPAAEIVNTFLNEHWRWMTQKRQDRFWWRKPVP